MPVTHKFVSGIADDASHPEWVRPSNWNDTHDVSVTVTSVTGNVTLDPAVHEHVKASGGAGGITVTLPDATLYSGKVFHVKKVDSAVGAVTIDTTSSQTIDGNATYLLLNQYQYVAVRSDGSNWDVIANN